MYAIGDCATVQNNVADHLVSFLRALAWRKGQDPEQMQLGFGEWRDVAARVRQRFPQAAHHLRRLDRLFCEHDTDGSGTLDFGELHALLRRIDDKLTSLPATAQRAHQQGQYLGRKFHKLAQAAPGLRANAVDYGDVDAAVYRAFQYRHLGSLAYIGNAAVFDLNGLNFAGGLMAVYLWRSVYFAQSVSLRTRILLAMDWSKRALFGRGKAFIFFSVCFVFLIILASLSLCSLLSLWLYPFLSLFFLSFFSSLLFALGLFAPFLFFLLFFTFAHLFGWVFSRISFS